MAPRAKSQAVGSRGRAPVADTTQAYIGHGEDLELGQRPTGEDIQLETSMSTAEYEAFMNEKVRIVVQSSQADNEAQVIQVGVNGVMQFIKRDMPIWIRRKYVEALSRSKSTSFAQDMNALGEAMNRVTAIPALRTQFMIMEDRNPAGRQWFEQLMAQPN